MLHLVAETWLRRCTNSRLASSTINSLRSVLERVIADWMPLLSRAASCRCSADCLREQLHRLVPVGARAPTLPSGADMAISRVKMERRLEPVRLSDSCLQVTCSVLDSLARLMVQQANWRRTRQQRSMLESDDMTAALYLLHAAAISTVTSRDDAAAPVSRCMLESATAAIDVLAEDDDV